MINMKPEKLDSSIDLSRDHVLGPPDAEMTLIEYGSYACSNCHAVHEVIARLRNRFGERMRYVYRHLPVEGSEEALQAAELAEYAAETTGRFWEVHAALMERGPAFTAEDFEQIVRDFDLPEEEANADARAAAEARVREDVERARRKGVRVTPTFFINGRRPGIGDAAGAGSQQLALGRGVPFLLGYQSRLSVGRVPFRPDAARLDQSRAFVDLLFRGRS
jgi:NhaA family Na+:H+ antiporter